MAVCESREGYSGVWTRALGLTLETLARSAVNGWVHIAFIECSNVGHPTTGYTRCGVAVVFGSWNTDSHD